MFCISAVFTVTILNHTKFSIKQSTIGSIIGKFAVFKAKIVGTPTPTVTWSRANGEILFHPTVCMQKYDATTEEHTLEVSVTITLTSSK